MDSKNNLGVRDISKELRRVARLLDKYDKNPDDELSQMASDGLVRKLTRELTHWVEAMDWIDD